METIKIGSRGPIVISLQQCLFKLGYNLGAAGVDGIFGQKTNDAVRQFQRDNGLVVDGIVGPLTWNKINMACSPSRSNKGFGLHIGLNEVNSAYYVDENGNPWDGKLTACEFDAQDMNNIIEPQGFKTKLLLTKEATRSLVINELENLSNELVSGDMLVLSYSGHGGQISDTNSDERDDQLDETWVLYDGELIDDELYALLGKFQAGVRIFVLSDSCHSGTVTREIQYREIISNTNLGINRDMSRFRFIPENVQETVYKKNQEFYEKIQRDFPAGERVSIGASVILISGCQDNQLSSDGDRNGLFTGILLEVWNNSSFQGGYVKFHKEIVRRMPVIQTPNYFKIGTNDIHFELSTPFTL